MDYYDMLADWDTNYQQHMRQEQPAAEQTHPLSHDSLIATTPDIAKVDDETAPEFTAREWARLRFLRELVRTGQISEWDLTPADQAVR